MGLDVKTLAAAKKYTKESLQNAGAVQGKPGNDGRDGVGISDIIKINTENLIDTYRITFTDGSTFDYTVKNGESGAQGLTGKTGETGEAGARGSLIYSGTSITGTSTSGAVFSGSQIASSLAGDLYLNTDTWNVYQCTLSGSPSSAKWSYKGNIKGAKGTAGAKGSDGAGCTSVALPAGGDHASHLINALYHKGAFVGISQCHGAVLAGYNYNAPQTSSETRLGNVISLGCSYWPFERIYAKNTAIQTSDRYKKENISDKLEDKYLRLFDNFSLCRYTMKNYGDEETLVNDKHKRYHFGVVAQDFEKTMQSVGLSNDDFSGLVSNFFAMYGNPRANVSLGWEACAENKDYSENTYNWKHRDETGRHYEVLNKIEEISVDSLHIDDYRNNIGCIMIEDNSKLTKEQPPVYINSILLEDADGNMTGIPLSDNIVKYYDIEDENFENPLSNAYINDEGQLVCEFSKMYGSVMMKLDESLDITQYEKVLIDYDHISEFKIFFLPEPIETEYQNANVWDRERNDQILYDYSFAYGELDNLSHYVLQETRKEFKQYKKDTTVLINNLLNRIEHLEGIVNGGNLNE